MTRSTLGGTSMIGWLCVMAGLVAGMMQPAVGDPASQVAAAAAQQRAALWSAATQLEAECQTSVAGQASAEKGGKMYAAVAQAYLKCGLQGLDKVAEYCQKALTCPQDVPTRVRLDFEWGQALLRKPVGQAAGADPAAATANRQQAVTRFLQALKVVLANQTATQEQPIPEAVPARQAVVLQNQLVSWRECLIECLSETYINVAGGRSELQQLATQVLDSPAVAQEILVEFDSQTDR